MVALSMRRRVEDGKDSHTDFNTLLTNSTVSGL